MHRLGKVQDWNHARGYGFIAPLHSSDGSGRTFFHIRDYRQRGRRPESGELVKYFATARPTDTEGNAGGTRCAAGAEGESHNA